MKTKNILWAALSMTAALVMTACTNDDNTVETPAAPQAEVKTIPYSVTVSGGDAATTRATVDEDMMTLRFAAGDKLYVFDGSSVVKGVLTLKSGDEGKSSGATFEGSLSYTGDEPAADHELNAVLVGSKSKLSTITDGGLSAGPYPTTSYCDDVATAVEEWSWLAGTGTYGEKSFTLSQSTTFLNFEITFEDGTKSGTKLTAVVKQNSTTTFCTADVTTKTEDGKVVAKFVLPLDDGKKLDGATVKMGDKEAISFGGDNQKLLGKVYNVKRTVKTATLLSTISSDYTAQDGETLTGTLGSNVKISIADGAKVTLKDVDINGSGTWTSGDYAGITCEGDATITLEGTNTVKGFDDKYPGIFVSSGKTLVINGTGELNASSNGSYDNGSGGAGIGGGNKMNCGNIEIQSGTVTATGNANGAGIGGGQDANCGNITISGGTVTATGGDRAAGIGGGRRGSSGTKDEYDTGSCGNITISGGTITATGGEDAAGIGGGRGNNNVMKSSCGTIEITSGVTSVTATKGSDYAQSIGAGRFGTCGDVTIEDGDKVTQK